MERRPLAPAPVGLGRVSSTPASLEDSGPLLPGDGMRPVELKRATSAPGPVLDTASETGTVASARDLEPAATAEQRCLICLDEFPTSELTVSGDVCGRRHCVATFCHECLGGYFKERVSASRFALPPMACAACKGRVPTGSWRTFVDRETFAGYERNAEDQLTFRCPSCDCTDILAQDCYAGGRERALDLFLARCRDARAVREAWASFGESQTEADAFLEILQASGPPDLQDVDVELRMDENGKFYSLNQFLEWYDREGWYEWGAEYEASEASDAHSDRITFGLCDKSTKGECTICGCRSEWDELGDRICFCDSCQSTGCVNLTKGECTICGCRSEWDELGDRICFCDSCQSTGCINVDVAPKPSPLHAVKGECLVCGCLSEADVFGDRICFCDSCRTSGCKPPSSHGCVACGDLETLALPEKRVNRADSGQATGSSHEDTRWEDAESRLYSCGSCWETAPVGAIAGEGGRWYCKPCWEGYLDESSRVHMSGNPAVDVNDGVASLTLTGLQRWEGAYLFWSPAKRRADNGRLYALAEFENYYGQAAGRKRWDDMPLSSAAIDLILSLVADIERRTALHLALLRRSPRFRTPCCGVDYCFKCQMEWHSLETCEEIARRVTADVQFCPSCQVPTQRTEGCSSMVCLCGRHWEWEGDDDDDY